MKLKIPTWISCALTAVCLTLALTVAATANEALGFKALTSGNHFAIMRHALAPGFSDPANFELRNCSTQRNLSQEGVEQAARIGERFKEHGITEARVYTSQWCRCIDTAKTLGIGKPEELAIINSFFQTPSRRDMQTESLKEWLLQQDLSKPLVLVTHQVNMTALTGAYPASGEIFIIERTRRGQFVITNKIQTR